MDVVKAARAGSKRRRVGRKAKKQFSRSAGRTKSANYMGATMRGGTRL